MITPQNSETTNPIQPGIPQTPSINPEIPTPKKTGVRTGLFNRIEFTEDSTGFHGGSRRRTGIKLAMWTWLSAAVDTLMMISLSCFFLIAFSLLMKTSAREVVQYVAHDLTLVKLFSGSFLLSFWTYMIFLRGFNGATIGEWTCSLRLGQPWQRFQSGYILRVLLRTSLIMATGIVTLPLLSLLFKRDLAGEVTGLKIYSLV